MYKSGGRIWCRLCLAKNDKRAANISIYILINLLLSFIADDNLYYYYPTLTLQGDEQNGHMPTRFVTDLASLTQFQRWRRPSNAHACKYKRAYISCVVICWRLLRLYTRLVLYPLVVVRLARTKSARWCSMASLHDAWHLNMIPRLWPLGG